MHKVYEMICLIIFLGDHRVNEQPALAAMHTIFMREHNRIATQLKNQNGDWSHDRIFEVSRQLFAINKQSVYHLPVLSRVDRFAKASLNIKELFFD